MENVPLAYNLTIQLIVRAQSVFVTTLPHRGIFQTDKF